MMPSDGKSVYSIFWEYEDQGGGVRSPLQSRGRRPIFHPRRKTAVYRENRRLEGRRRCVRSGLIWRSRVITCNGLRPFGRPSGSPPMLSCPQNWATSVLQDPLDRAAAEVDAKVAQRTRDPCVSPVRILCGHTYQELLDVGLGSWASRPAPSRESPFPSYQNSVPAARSSRRMGSRSRSVLRPSPFARVA